VAVRNRSVCFETLGTLHSLPESLETVKYLTYRKFRLHFYRKKLGKVLLCG